MVMAIEEGMDYIYELCRFYPKAVAAEIEERFGFTCFYGAGHDVLFQEVQEVLIDEGLTEEELTRLIDDIEWRL